MSIFAITSHQYTITLYTPGHLKIIWELFAKKNMGTICKKRRWNPELSQLIHWYLNIQPNYVICIGNLIHLLASDLAECYMTHTNLVVTWYSSTYYVFSSPYLLWFVDFIGSLGKTMTCPRCRPGSKSENLGILRRQTSLSEQPTPPTAMSFLFLPKYGSKSMLKEF